MKKTQLSEAATLGSSGFTLSTIENAVEPTTNDAAILSNDDTKKVACFCGSDEVVVTVVVAEEPTSVVKDHDAEWVKGLFPISMTRDSMYDARQSTSPPRPDVVDPVAGDLSNDDTKKVACFCGSDEVVVTVVVAEEPTSVVKDHDAEWVKGLFPISMTRDSMYADARQSTSPPRPDVADPVAGDVAPPIDTTPDKKATEEAAAKCRDEVLEWAKACFRKADPETWPVHTLHVRGMGPIPEPRYFDSLRGSPRRSQFADLRQRLGVLRSEASLRGGMPPKTTQPPAETPKDDSILCEFCNVAQPDSKQVRAMHVRTKAHKMAERVWHLGKDVLPENDLHCLLCDERFKSVEGMKAHKASKIHNAMVDVHERCPNTKALPVVPSGARHHEPRGIINHNNSCFASAFFQALAAVPAVVKSAVETENFQSQTHEEICRAMRLLSRPSPKRKNPVRLLELLDSLPQFRTETFFDEIIDADGEPTGNWESSFVQQDACEFGEHVLSRECIGDIVETLFATVKTKNTCRNCLDVKTVTDTMAVTRMKFKDLPEKGTISLEQLWKAQFQEDTVESYGCEACMVAKEENTASTLSRIGRYPETLFIQINRAAINGVKHRGLGVQIPDVFEPSPGTKYHLRAIIKHRGPSSQSGHYVTERLFNGSWFCVDDETVTRGRNMVGDPYAVLYTKDGSDLPAMPATAHDCLRRLAGKKRSVLSCEICHSEWNNATFEESRGLKKHSDSPEHKQAQFAYALGVKAAPVYKTADWCDVCQVRKENIKDHMEFSLSHKVNNEAYLRGKLQAVLGKGVLRENI